MHYQHRMLNGEPVELPLGKVVCVGRNYADHAKELNNPVPTEPILFIKPATAVVPLAPSFTIPAGRGECHHETEIALLIGKPLTRANPESVRSAILGLGIGLDLTLRDLQTRLKQQGHPWEQAKAFDGACPLSAFVPAGELQNFTDLTVSLTVNNELRQQGNTAQMLFPILDLVALISDHFTLLPGDVVLTGTPAGVAPLAHGDKLEATLEASSDRRYCFKSRVL
ncbi:MAG: isomerase/hydrolase [Gammaproteobacteria bacterium]|nr:MAG: isomerase/hydrolase [Gammaproteobacteria bacterium]